MCGRAIDALRSLKPPDNLRDRQPCSWFEYTKRYPDLTESVADRVMDQILTQPSTKPTPAKPSLLRGWKRKYSFALAAVALASTVFFSTELLLDRTVPQSPPALEYATIRLQIELPQAQQVVVVGDWNQWDPSAQRLARVHGSDLWVIELSLDQERNIGTSL